MRGEFGIQCKGKEEADTWGRRKRMLWEGENGRKGSERGEGEVGGSRFSFGEGTDSTIGVKNFSPFVSV